MAELRSICEGIDCNDVRTYIQSGNVVFTSSLSAEALEERLEQAIEQQLRLTVPVVVRSASSWGRYVKGNPFPDEAKEEGNRVLLGLSKRPPKANAASELQQRATLGERVVRKGDAIWIHYANGIGRSKLSPAVLDRHVGSSVTARNWRTVMKLDEMLRETAAG
jgi:uncharacterized protein (DUF1697 family)